MFFYNYVIESVWYVNVIKENCFCKFWCLEIEDVLFCFRVILIKRILVKIIILRNIIGKIYLFINLNNYYVFKIIVENKLWNIIEVIKS